MSGAEYPQLRTISLVACEWLPRKDGIVMETRDRGEDEKSEDQGVSEQ
jgi:hypothetical protein